MNAYLDSSVVVRKLQREPGSLATWGQWEYAYSSELLRVEVSRTIDRSRLNGVLTDHEAAHLADRARAIFERIEFVALNRPVLNRAAQSFLTPLGTLDALHLATALGLAERRRIDLVFVTHDTKLALAARAVNFAVEGV